MKIIVSPCNLYVVRWMFIRLTNTAGLRTQTHFVSITFYSALSFSAMMTQVIYAVQNRRRSEKPYFVTRDQHIPAKVVSLYTRNFSGGDS
jgi:hypothetical protein